jgi:hypothetical protein
MDRFSYLIKAEECAEHAMEALDDHDRVSWMRLAEAYMRLAAQADLNPDQRAFDNQVRARRTGQRSSGSSH